MSELDLMCDLLPKVIISTICGIIIGIEREINKKVAGIRTHVLISVGVTLFTSIVFVLSKEYFNLDPTRIIGQIITGIGFLGGGVIFKTSDNVVGVTSAAFIWVMSSIGVIIGLGFLITPLLLTLGLVFVSISLRYLERILKN